MTDILVIEDTPSLRKLYEAILRGSGNRVQSAETATGGLELFRRLRPRVMVLDLMLPDGDGLALMTECLRLAPQTNVVVVTANRSVPVAVEAMRAGAHDFLVKPFEPSQLIEAVVNAQVDLVRPATTPTKPLPRFCGFIGTSPEMQKVYARVQSTARSMATTFITGESGTGKDICARAIHSCSPRSGGPFVRVGCSEISPERLESEIFGHLRGAFSGALSDKTGAAALAHCGTLFLDDICDMSVQIQTKLLRFLQTSTVWPLGATQSRNVNVRLICATERDPGEEVRQGRFRQDLFYRLHVVPIHLPPVRAREADVIQIAEDSLKRYARDEAKGFTGLSKEVEELFLRHDWPGNVRQVMSVIQNIAVLHDGDLVMPNMLPEESGFGAPPAVTRDEQTNPLDDADRREPTALVGRTLAEIERRAIEACIARHGGSVPQAARELDVAPSTIYRKRASWP